MPSTEALCDLACEMGSGVEGGGGLGQDSYIK